jgi:hypothetical protein
MILFEDIRPQLARFEKHVFLKRQAGKLRLETEGQERRSGEAGLARSAEMICFPTFLT